MVVRNKLYNIIDKYRSLLKGDNKRGVQSKNRILNFYFKTGKWPNRTARSKIEKSLGTRLENFLSKESFSYDKNLRRIVINTGRKSNNKRKHNIAKFKQDIVEFLKKYGRVPTTSYEFQTIEGEARLRNKLDYYTKKMNDKRFLGIVYDYDKCHLSGIPVKYRKIINESLSIEKPLIRLV